MDRIRFYKYALWVLVLLNLVLIGLILLETKEKGNSPHRRPPMRERAADILKLNEDQSKVFHDLARKHAEEIININRRQEVFIKSYFSTMDSSFSNPALDSISFLDTKKITLTYNHFNEVKSILNEDQLGNFDDFIKQALGNIIGNKSQPPPPRRH